MKQKNVILMVVAVGCGLVAAFLTSQMTAKNQEMVDVLVASRDLSVGTTFTKEEISKQVAYAKRPKEGLPPVLVNNPDDLLGKKLSRPIHAGETFNPADLSVGGVVIPDGYDMVTMPASVISAAGGFVGPGSRVDVIASARFGSKVHVFPLLVNMQVLAVDNNTTYEKNGVFTQLSGVSFAVTNDDTMLLNLAQARGATLSLRLRNANKKAETPEEEAKVRKEAQDLLKDDQNQNVVKPGGNNETNRPNQPDKPIEVPVLPENTKKPEVEAPKQPEVIAPRIAMVKVPMAKADIAPNTDITGDLIADAFEWKELPKDLATDAVTDLGEFTGKVLKTGVAKGQWVTKSMVGAQAPKPAPQDPFVPPTPMPVEPKDEKQPVQPAEVNPVVKRKTHDVAIHTPSGTVIYRYEEVKPGQWKKVAELTPEQAAIQDDKKDAPKPDAKKPEGDAPKAAEKKVD